MSGGGHDERDALLLKLDGVGGWLADEEAWQLREAARTAVGDAPSAVVVEIGAFVGRSTICLAAGLAARGGGRVYSIDPFDLVDGQYETFAANVDRSALGHLVEPVHALSHDAMALVPSDARLAVLYVDGSHEYDDVKQDVTDWVPRVHSGGVVVFNDPFLRPVSHALRDAAATPTSGLRRPRWVQNCLFFDHRPHAPWTRRDAVDRVRLRCFLALGHRWARARNRITASASAPTWAKRLPVRVGHVLFGLLVPRLEGSQPPVPETMR